MGIFRHGNRISKVMTKKVFKPAPFGEWQREAHVGDQQSIEYFCARGFFMAGDLLAKKAVGTRRSPDRNALFFPICFNYRHYLELSLKKLIAGLEDYHQVLEDFAKSRGKLQTSVTSLLQKTHSLEKLFGWLFERFQLVTEQEFYPDVKDTIIAIHNMDPDGQGFRYPLRKDGKVALPTNRKYDLENIRKRMDQVELYLSGIDCWMHEESQAILEYAHEMQEDYQDHYEDYQEDYDDHYENLTDYSY